MNETLKSVVTAAGGLNWGLLLTVGAVLAVAGWYFLIHRPGRDAKAKAVAAQAASIALADMGAALKKSHGVIDSLTALLREHIDAAPPVLTAQIEPSASLAPAMVPEHVPVATVAAPTHSGPTMAELAAMADSLQKQEH